MKTDEEIKFRLSADDKALITWAAAIEGTTVTRFLREPALDRARALKERADPRQLTLVPARFFDDLMATLDTLAEPIPALRDVALAALSGAGPELD